MGYDLPDRRFHEWGQDSTFGSTSVVHYIQGPKGKVGFVRDISVDVTTALVGTTSVPEIDVGISSGDFTYGRYRLGTSASLGYGLGMHQASAEAITGNPPRTLGDFSGHVVLDGGPYTSVGVAGGSYSTQFPQGRIPAGPFTVINDVSGTSGVCRLTLKETIPPNLLTGQLVTVQGINGETGANGVNQAISAINLPGNYIEISGTTFSGTYTGGGLVFIEVVVTCKLGVGGSPAGGGYVRVLTDWLGAMTP